jgi:hypothetical protein
MKALNEAGKAARHRLIMVETTSDPGDPDSYEVTAASIPEDELATLIEEERIVQVRNQDGCQLLLSIDMDGETLVCAPYVPVLVDQETGLRVRMAPYATLAIPFEAAPGEAGLSDYADLVGPDIGSIMARVGWQYSGALIRIDAFAPDERENAPEERRMVASAWAGPIVAADGSRGINLSYAVAPAHRGSGLGQILSYCAVAECVANQALQGERAAQFVNIQARTSNLPSQGVARSLGIPQCDEAAFVVRKGSSQIPFVGFREPAYAFLARGLAPTLARMPRYDPGLMAAARIGLSPFYDENMGLVGKLKRSSSAAIAECLEDEEPESSHSPR